MDVRHAGQIMERHVAEKRVAAATPEIREVRDEICLLGFRRASFPVNACCLRLGNGTGAQWQEKCCKFSVMGTSTRRNRLLGAVLLCGLLLLTSAERRLAYLDFQTAGDLRIENNEKPDGDEIINRLIFVDDAAEPIAPTVGDACHAVPLAVESCTRSLITVRLSESRAPPLVVPSHV
jgi:hypothetical protein